jgi:hypothetical protein
MTTKRSKPPPRAPEDGGLAVFDGQKFVGSILEIGAGFVSCDARGRFVGAFRSLMEASRLIHQRPIARTGKELR